VAEGDLSMAQPHRARLAVLLCIGLIVLGSASGEVLMSPASAALAEKAAIGATPTNTRVPTPTPIPGTIRTPLPPPTRPPLPPPRPTPTPLGPPQPFLPIADAYVRAGADANRNFGADSTLMVKDGSDDVDRRTFLRFDLRSLATTRVRRAVLKLYVSDLPNGTPAPFRSAAIADDSWDEATLTWNTQPSLGSSGMQYNVTTAGWFSLDLIGYVNTQLATDKVVSLALFDDTVARRMIQWSSKEGTHPPILEITP
jgi:hypothetical protein